jgi:hypothetical protein
MMMIIQINFFLYKMEAGKNREEMAEGREREKRIMGVRDRA